MEEDGSDHQAGVHPGKGATTQPADDDSRWKRERGKLLEDISDDSELPNPAEAKTRGCPQERWGRDGQVSTAHPGEKTSWTGRSVHPPTCCEVAGGSMQG